MQAQSRARQAQLHPQCLRNLPRLREVVLDPAWVLLGARLPLLEALEIGMQLCHVLTYLHTRQPPIIFRDLTPVNIMRAEDGHLYLIDFGIARFFKPGQAKDTASHGSVGYSPPEQYGRVQTTPRSDIYSLGAIQ